MNNFHLREGKIEFRWKRWRNKKRQEVSSCLMVLFSGMVVLGAGGVALAGPTGGQITGGTGSINQSGPTTNINQASDVLNINWRDFSIGASETVNFNQPGATSIAINRVVGGVPSQLAGALNANGRVFILNSAGITFTGTSHVNVGALLATTAMTINGDPHNASFSGSGYGAVINQGSIEVSNGGFAILAAPYVQNTGFIKADLGTIALAGTNSFTLDLRGDGLINFVVPAGTVEQIKADGKAVGVDNSGTLQARSGQVIISANVASQVVNAVVNLNGVVDADAFAPNGTGGSVLVTAQGDINVGGQVTARGEGTGPGGQVVTKAGNADTIENLGFVSAAGGAAGGKGGFIEVSGHELILAGAIDPGSGGSLLIDPANMLVTPFSGANNSAAAVVNEHFVEQQLQANHNVTLAADHDIAFAGGTNATFIMHGGAGNLKILAGTGDVSFKAADYIFRTGAGDVSLTAGGSIGDPAHRLSVVSGVGADLPGVTQAGDIKLKTTTGNIFVRTVTAKASGNSQFTALFSASAGHNFNAGGLIDVEAHASGIGAQRADAEIHINAHNNILLHGITDSANAFEPFGGGNVFANAIVTLNGQRVTDSGNLTLDAEVAGASGFSFLANADLTINDAGFVQITGGVVDVTAKANVFSASSVNANAKVHFNDDGQIALSSIDVEASALGNKVGNEITSALAEFHGQSIEIAGNAIVDAHGAAPRAVYVLSKASLDASGTHIDIGHDAVVEASANNANLGRSASASANLFISASDGNASVNGNVSVTALALNGGGSKDADAFARLGISAAHSIEIDGDITVTANGHTLFLAGSDISTPHASANADLTAETGGILITGNLDVEAQASSVNLDSVTARARAHLRAAHTGDESSGGSIEIRGTARVLANAFDAGDPGALAASANAQLAFSGAGRVEVGGDMSILAHAVNQGHGRVKALGSVDFGSASNIDLAGVTIDVKALNLGAGSGGAKADASFLATASNLTVRLESLNLQAQASSHGGGNATAHASGDIRQGALAIGGDVTVNAFAVSANGAGNALAQANLFLTASSEDLSVGGHVDVTATARDLGFGGGNAQASAIASLVAASSEIPRDIHIGSAHVTANALDAGGGEALALASFFLDPASMHISGDVAVKADALNVGGNPGAIAASADALLGFLGPGKIVVGGAMSIQAHATNLGRGKVVSQGRGGVASASSIDLADVTIDVKALNLGTGARAGSGGANANASFIATSDSIRVHLDALNLQAQASSHGGGGAHAHAIGKITQSTLSIPGDITVNAMALNAGGAGNATALADLELVAGSFDLSVGGNIDVEARASDFGLGFAGANAHVLLESNSTIHVAGGITVEADAFEAAGNPGNTAASGTAQLIFSGAPVVSVGGDISVAAHATNLGQGKVVSRGGIAFSSASSSIDLAGVTIDVKALNLGPGSNGARAAASFIQTDPGVHVHLSALNLQAQASSHGSGGATANAIGRITQDSLFIAGSVAVNAAAFNAGPNGSAKALADLELTASTGDLIIGGGIAVTAAEFSDRARRGAAFAIAKLEAGTGEAEGAADLLVGGNIRVEADAGGGSESADVGALASLTAFAARNEKFGGAIAVIADTDDHGNGAAFADAFASLDASSGSVSVNGNINVQAALLGNGLEFGTTSLSPLGIEDRVANVGFASAELFVTADDGAIGLNGVTVAAAALLTNPGPARFTGEELARLADGGGGPAGGGARATLEISASSGDVALRGPINVSAAAQAAARDLTLLASANGSIDAGSGNISLARPLTVAALSQALGTEDAAAEAVSNAQLFAGGDITLPGAGVWAKAVAPVSEFGDASAFATLLLSAGEDIAITHSGAFARASANAPFATSHAVVGSADLQILAGHDVSIQGNLIVTAVALGGGTGNSANAIVNVQADSSSLGSGNLNMFGDIVALAFADPQNDHALASITLHAHNDIFVIGDDPIANAHAGTAAAFLQVHFTDSLSDSGANGSLATARITITAGGSIVFVPLDESQRLALQALPTHTPNLNSGSLTSIQLLIDGQDCGVLGSAGADQGKGQGCAKSAINFEGPDVLP